MRFFKNPFRKKVENPELLPKDESECSECNKGGETSEEQLEKLEEVEETESCGKEKFNLKRGPSLVLFLCI